MYQRVLVIVDMQKDFPAYKKALPGVLKQVKYARRYNWPVICLEYERIFGQIYTNDSENVGLYQLAILYKHEPTHRLIRTALHHHPYFRVRKKRDDGSPEVIKTLDRKKITVKVCRVCGINTEGCVHDTCEGLKKFGFKIEIPVDATHSWCDNGELNRTEVLDVLKRLEEDHVVDQIIY